MIKKLNNLNIECITLIDREYQFNSTYVNNTYRIKVYNSNNSYFNNFDFTDKDEANKKYKNIVSLIEKGNDFTRPMGETKVDNCIFKLNVIANKDTDIYKLEVVSDNKIIKNKTFKNINQVISYYKLNGVRI